MKREKGFTIVELVIVIVVASILFAIITGLAVLTRGIVVSQKATTSSLQEYQTTKSSIEKFINNYCNDEYGIELANENQVEIYLSSQLENEDRTCIAKLVFDSELQKLTIYQLNDELEPELVETSRVNFSQITNIIFTANETANLLKTLITFKDFNDYEFLVNLGGLKIGNLY